jgi:WD40 repeat protein
MRWDLRDDLHGTEVLTVRWSPPGVENGESTSETIRSKASETPGGDLVRHGGVMCLDFSEGGKYFVIGTEEGKIHKCSLSYSDQYLASYASHIGPVYDVKMSPYHERVFVTCSADWSVRVFLDDARTDDDNAFASIDDSSSRLKPSSLIQPRLVIEYSQQPINAVDWSPWCATEFALVTDAGTIEIWDLASSTVVPKHEVSITDDKTAAVSVTYAHDAPVIFVGCASGSTHILRMKWRDPTEGVVAKETQRERLEDILGTKG